MEDAANRFDVQPTASNHFAWMNTQLAMQRTLMAGVRTSVSLIGFGFTVAQFFERMQGKIPEDMRWRPEAPRNLGLTLIAAGVFLLAMFLWQFRRATKYMWAEPYSQLAGVEGRKVHTGAYAAAWVVLAIGAAAFISVLERF
jgi:putative membrane protein